jgi:hypothetical protein
MSPASASPPLGEMELCLTDQGQQEENTSTVKPSFRRSLGHGFRQNGF